MKPRELTSDSLSRLAEQHGTPLHVVHAGTIRDRIASLGAFDRVRYAQKANSNLALLELVRASGAQVDAVSAGELRRALRAGFAPADIRYTADAFEPEALSIAREHGIALNVGSSDMLDELARSGARAELWLRLNPGFGHGHGRRVQTGGPGSKHGIWHAEFPAAVERARASGLRVHGLHVHIGSGSDLEHLARVPAALSRFAPLLADELRAISAGGGLPVPQRPGEARFDLDAYAALWLRARDALCSELGRAIELEVEPGRYIVAEAGVLLTRVLGRKRTSEQDFVLVDAGFNDFLRPTFYGAYHHIELLGARDGPHAPRIIAGPLCESADLLTIDAEGAPAPRLLPELTRGDLLCIHDTGAYGSAMASSYNARPLAAQVLVDGSTNRLIRRRQDFESMIADECV